MTTKEYLNGGHFGIRCMDFDNNHNWKCDSQELFERKLVDYFVHHYSRNGSSGKGLNLKYMVI